jgi:hypothetical protein
MKHSDRRVRRCAVDCLVQLNDPSIIMHWGPSSSLMNNFWKISSQTVVTIARQILEHRQNEELQRFLLELLAKMLVSRNSFLSSIVVCILIGKLNIQITNSEKKNCRILHTKIQKLMNVFKQVLLLRLLF